MTGTALAFPTPTSLGSLDHYIQAVNRFPLLTAEQLSDKNKKGLYIPPDFAHGYAVLQQRS